MQANNMIFVKDPISGITTTAGFIVAQHQLNFIGGNSSIKNKKSKKTNELKSMFIPSSLCYLRTTKNMELADDADVADVADVADDADVADETDETDKYDVDHDVVSESLFDKLTELALEHYKQDNEEEAADDSDEEEDETAAKDEIVVNEAVALDAIAKANAEAKTKAKAEAKAKAKSKKVKLKAKPKHTTKKKNKAL